MLEVKKEKINIGKNVEKSVENFQNNDLRNFFSENFSDSKILQKNILSKFKNIFSKKSEKISENFSHLNFLNFLFKIKKEFLGKKISFEKISFQYLEMNLKNFDEIFSFCEKKISNKKNFSELNIFLENEKKYLEIVNCDLILDFGDEKEKIEITLQSDEFVKSTQ